MAVSDRFSKIFYIPYFGVVFIVCCSVAFKVYKTSTGSVYLHIPVHLFAHTFLTQMGQTQAKPHTEKFNPKKHLTKVELVSIKTVFRQLKTDFPDSFQCIQQKQFLSRLGLPKSMEESGNLLFKSFSYLGSYPSCRSEGPVPLSFEAFLTAFVVLTGRLDRPNDLLSESLFLKSLSILPEPKKEEPTVVEEEEERYQQGTVLSLESLGIDFNDLDSNPPTVVDDGPEILAKDLIQLIVLNLWLCGNEDLSQNLMIAESLTDDLEKSKDGTCIPYHVFSEWRTSFCPQFVKPIQKFLVHTLSYVQAQENSLLIDMPPVYDQSNLLSLKNRILLCWALPQLKGNAWERLYSAEQDGFSMNRFESHVFKYPGPTLMLISVDASLPNKETRPMLIGAYVPQTWKNSTQFWGTQDCVLFELEPSFNVYRATGRNNRYIHYHHDTGIGFGAREEQKSGFIISLANTLQEGVYENETYPRCPTFKSNRNRDFKYAFETVHIEVFALGTEKDRRKQEKEWMFERNEAEKRSGLRIGNSEVDKEVLKMAGIIEERQER
ncbi:TLD-domain-containing protein [Sporodiniella umbellata]|nr:TLD-domain-containing protein [Sporodiniella umbellata]